MSLNIRSKPVLLGIIVDVSASMSVNWNNRDGKEIPRIKVIKDSINSEIKRISDIYGKRAYDKKADIFCIGLGFRVPMEVNNNGNIDNYNPLAVNKRNRLNHIGFVCDVIALSEIVPTNEEMKSIEDELNKKWNGYAREILKSADIEDSLYDQFKNYIQSSLHASAHFRLNKSIKNKIYHLIVRRESSSRVIYRISSFFRRYINYWESRIYYTSFAASEVYLDSIKSKSRDIFKKNRSDYENIIIRRLERFVMEQTEQVLSALAVGYTVSDVVSLFKEEQAYELAKEIYYELERDVKKKIAKTWALNNIRLFIRKVDIHGHIDLRKISALTEKCIQKCTWDLLEPLVRGVVQDLFVKSFRKNANIMLPQWINMASGREVTRSLKQIVNIFPDVYEEDFYSENYVFGNTPMSEALERASVRMLDEKYKRHSKVLVIVSDGEYIDDRPIKIVDRLKFKGVKVIGCCVAERDILGELTRTVSEKWPDGAKTLFYMSSIINNQDDFERRIAKIVKDFPDGMRMFIQLNQSKNLEDLLNIVLVDE